MKTTRSFGIWIVLATLILSSIACSFSPDKLKAGSVRLTLKFKEKDVNLLLTKAHDDNQSKDQLLKEVKRIEMHDGFVRAFGPYEKPDGSKGDGSYDVTFRAENGELKAQITGVDMEGVTLESTRVRSLNEELATSLAQSAKETNGEAQFESVEITDDAMTMVILTQWGKK